MDSEFVTWVTVVERLDTVLFVVDSPVDREFAAVENDLDGGKLVVETLRSLVPTPSGGHKSQSSEWSSTASRRYPCVYTERNRTPVTSPSFNLFRSR